MAGFLSALNDRVDGYGGPRENRARLPLGFIGPVLRTVADDYVLECASGPMK